MGTLSGDACGLPRDTTKLSRDVPVVSREVTELFARPVPVTHEPSSLTGRHTELAVDMPAVT